MPQVRVSVPVRYGYGGRQELMTTTYDMDFLPDVGDVIHPLKNDTESGMTMRIDRRFWMEDGSTQLEIAKYIVDPPDAGRLMPDRYTAWWTEDESGKDLVELLQANGWWKYGEEPVTTVFYSGDGKSLIIRSEAEEN